jgi:hypothetical protein
VQPFAVLFNDAVSNSDYIASNEWVVVNNGFERMWKEAAAAYLKVESGKFPSETEEIRGNPPVRIIGVLVEIQPRQYQKPYRLS